MNRVAALPLVFVLALVVAPTGAAAVSGAPPAAHQENPCVGTVTDSPDRGTVVSIQGPG
jgi:hypothetical protein